MSSSYQYLTTTLLVLLVLLTIITVLPTSISPILLTSPDTGSMEPTIETTDLVVIHTSNSYESGDIILYQDANVPQPVLHRIVGDTTDGFITQGDANEVTDQSSGLEPVTEQQVLGKVLSYNGSPVVIPYIGIAYSNTEILLLGWILITLFTLLGSNVKREHYESHTKRSELQIATAIIIFTCIGVVAVTVAFPVSESASFLVTQNPPEEDTSVVGPSEVGTETVEVTNSFKLFTTVYAESNSNQIRIVETKRESYDTTIVTVENEPQDQIGTISADIQIYTYVRVLPRGLIYSLANIHPILPAISTMAVLGSFLLIIIQFLIDPREPPRMSKTKIREIRNSR